VLRTILLILFLLATDLGTVNAFSLIPSLKTTNTEKTDPQLEKVVIDGLYYDWTVYYTNVKYEEKQCYMVSFGKKQEGNYKVPRKPFIAITIFKNKNTEEFSVFADYKYKIKSAIYLGIGNKQFRLFTNEMHAWAKTSSEDTMIIENLMKADNVRIRGETVSGEYTIDYYELNGMARAYKRIHELCR
jgi:hypothetical protein